MISVVTCTHNPRSDYILRVVESLRCQTLPIDQWEYIVIDNASTEPIQEQIQLDWHPSARVVREEKLGLTLARLRGIRDSLGALLVFVDDDNFLDHDFLEQAQHIADENPFIGAFSGQCRPEFEEEPPDWTRRYWGNLVIRQFEGNVWSNLPRLPETMPCGAGLCLRRDVAMLYVQKQGDCGNGCMLDRRGASLVSGGDNDMAACACDLNQGVGLFTALKLTHRIPRERLTLDYLARLAEGIQFSSTILDVERGIMPSRRGFGSRLADLLRLGNLAPKEREIARAVARGRRRAIKILNEAGAIES